MALHHGEAFIFAISAEILSGRNKIINAKEQVKQIKKYSTSKPVDKIKYFLLSNKTKNYNYIRHYVYLVNFTCIIKR